MAGASGVRQVGDLRALHPALQVLAGGGDRQLSLVRDGRAVTGRVLERYAAVPSLADARALLPLDASCPTLRAALEQHAARAASPLARAAASILQVASRVGLAKPLLRSRLLVTAPGNDLAETPLHAFLAELLGRKDFATSLRLAPNRPNSKPVVQALAPDGSVLAYAKFGWEEVTRRLIRHEAATLTELGPLTRGTLLRVPEVMHSGAWHGLETLVLVPLEGTGRTPRGPVDVPVAASVALANTRARVVGRLRDSPFWRRTRARVAQVEPVLATEARRVLLAACDAVEARWGGVDLPTGQIHGDWIPPNMLIRSDGVVNVWDWERSATDAPLGIDAVQFLVYLELRRFRPNWGADSRMRRYAREALSRHGLDPGHAALLAMLSLLEMALWYGEAIDAGRDGDPGRFSRFVDALAAVLDQR